MATAPAVCFQSPSNLYSATMPDAVVEIQKL